MSEKHPNNRSKDASKAVNDDTPLVDPGNMVVGEQLDPGLVMHAVPLTKRWKEDC